MADEQILVNTGKRSMTLDELGSIQPGMARLMPEVGVRVWKLYYAAQAGNWPMARFQLKEAVKLLQLCTFVRPKYTADMETFITSECDAVREAIEAGDLAAFDTAYAAMVEATHAYHEQYDKPFIRWKTPDSPPPDLDLNPR